MTGIGTQIKNALGWFLTRLKGNVVNNLTSTSTDLPLSAAKGKDLQDQITSLNTNMKQGGVRLIPWVQINPSTINYADYSSPLKIFWVNGWDNNLASLTPTPSLTDFWCVLHIPCTVNKTQSTENDMSFIKQIWLGLNGNRLFTRSYWKDKGWNAFVEK